MRTLINALQVAVGLVIAAVSLAVMTAVGLAFVGIALVVGIAAAVTMKLSGAKPAPAMARRNAKRKDGEPRIWNDGRGTIIDM